MKTKNIFKTLAFAMLMPTMLLTTACSSDELVDTEGTETIVKKGYTLPVTVNVTRQGDETTTRTAYNESTRKLEFTAGDGLFVQGSDDTAGDFAGELSFTSGTTFEGTITTTNAYTGTADALLTAASTVTATLLPADYGTTGNGYLTLSGSGAARTLAVDATKAIATGTDAAAAKKTAVEQLSYYQATTYSSGFSLAPQNAILSYSISGLANSTAYTPSITDATTTISGSVTSDASGNAYFAVTFAPAGSKTYTLSIDGYEDIAVADRTLTAGKVYNKTETATAAAGGISAASEDGTTGNYTDANGVEREGIVVTLGSSKYLIATANETDLTGITAETNTKTVDGITYYTWANACTKFANGVTDGTYTTANVWRLPTQAELTALVGLTSTWDSTNKGYNWTIGSASLFLPAAGDCNNGNAGYVGGLGLYWSSTPDDEYSAYRLNFGSHYSAEVDIAGRDYGYTVRLFCQLPSE